MQTSWDLGLVLQDTSEKSISKLRKEVESESYKFINKWKKRTDYLENPAILKKALDEYNTWQEKFGANQTEQYYFHLLSSLDQNDPKVKASEVKAREFGIKLENDIQFFELNVSKISPKDQKKFINYKDLAPFRHFLEKLFRAAKYLLTENEEKIMNLKSETSYSNWTRMTNSFLSKEERSIFIESGKKEIKSFSDILGLTSDKNKMVRDSAALAFNEILSKHSDVAENEINSVFQHKKNNDEIRGYRRPDESRHLGDDMDTDVVDILVEVISNNLHIPKKFYKLKAKLMGVPKLAYHERSVEYGNISKNYEFKEGVEILTSVFGDLDQEFKDIFLKFVNGGRIDVYPKKGKASGAFCTYGLITHPVYVLLNWTNKLNDVLTFAHELGHGINDELVKRSQNAINFGTPTSTAEVASTFMEDFVLQDLMNTADDKTKLALMMKKLDDDIATIFRQIAFYNFETELHKEIRNKGYLPKEEIGKIFQKHMVSYMGPAVEQSAGSENWWIYVNHFRYFFYVYSYASGLLISKSLQNSVKQDSKFIGKVKEFLSAGLSDSPKNIFAKMGVDITNKKFWGKGIKEVESLLQETENLAKKLGKI